jgi:glycosyltransferase involved in cell wall biosynthesis
MNILLLHAYNPFKASGVVALNLFNDLKTRGHKVKMLTNVYDADYPEGILSMETSASSYWKKSRIKNKIVYLKRKYKFDRKIEIDSRFDFFEFEEAKNIYRTKQLLRKAGFKPDFIVVLFAKTFINSKNIFELYKKTRSPIYWLMYDMAPLTGGCHYAWECKGYQNSCGGCPGLYSSDPFDITYKNLAYKKYFLEKAKVELITASEWQYQQAKVSSLFKDSRIHKILLSFDPQIFKPVDKALARIHFEIPANRKIIFFGSIALTTLRKGMIYLLESLKILKKKIKGTKLDNDILLLIAGSEIKEVVNNLPFEYHYLGLVDNTFGIASAYQVSDLFICPSIEDSGPSMINQSIMCGTPVVSFEMGVALDLVINGKTGYRAKLADSEDMAQGLFDILTLSDEGCSEMSENCRQLALKLCSPEVQIELFEKLFEN